MFMAKKTGGDFELPPEGTFQGVVFAVFDGGQQPDNFKPGETIHKMRFGIELDECYSTGQYAGQRMTRYPEYSVSLGDKANLLPVVEALLQRALTSDEKENGFDLEQLIGKNCQVTIIHKESTAGKMYADTKIGALMKKITPIEPLLATDYMPQFIKDWIAKGQKAEESDSSETLTKVQMFNAVQDNIQKHPELKADYQKAWLKMGGSLSVVTDEQMQEIYWEFGV